MRARTAIALFAAAAALCAPAAALSAGATVMGKLEWPADYPHAADALVTLTPADPTLPTRTAWATVGGDFELVNAPTHASAALDVSAPGLVFPRVLLTTDAASVAKAWYADAPDAGGVPIAPLTLRPTARAAHFHEAPPFNLVAFLQTPYGMLLAFVAFAVFALPRMKLDPDELEELMAQARGGGNGGGGNGPAPRAPQLAGRPPAPAPGGGGDGLQRRRQAQVVIEEVD